MEQEEFIAETSGESLGRETQVARFRTYAKEHFQDLVKREVDYLEFIKKSAQFYSFRLPPDKGELFIRYTSAPFFWLCDSPALTKFEEWLKQESKGRSTALEGYRTIKEFYSKWATLKSEQEKKYYSLSTLKLIERETNKDNILVHIFHAVILTYDKKLFNPAKASEILQNALMTLENLKLDAQLKSEFQYLLYIYLGFALLKQLNYEEAAEKFTAATNSSPIGITAKFYLAYAARRAGSPEAAMMMLNELLHFDKEAIEYAVEMNSMMLMAYYIRHAVTYEIFAEPDFADLLEEIEAAIAIETGIKEFSFVKISDALSKLGEAKVKEFYTEELEKSMAFLDKTSTGLIGNRNTIADYTLSALHEKLMKIVENIVENIRQKFMAEVYDQLKQFDITIDENLNIIKHLEKEEEEMKNLQKKKLEDQLEELETAINENIAFLEDKIENIHLDAKFNPHTVFNNSMVYNLIVTLVVFTIGAFAGCSRSSLDNSEGLRDVMSTVMLGGIKWGLVTFFIGTIISAFTAAFAVMERTTEKQNLLRKITYFKSHKEREVELLTRESEKRIKTIGENFKERVTDHKRTVDRIRSEKESLSAELLEEANKKIDSYKERLDVVVKAET
ncbi:MAG: tetratricopeptide repeat protein [Ignavibacteria bacterium]|jgi:tetratricopeptide (TPR) repeat protein|nr:tetratricopeptide repeat protein [Ignavibacteria bacterium]